MPKINFNPLSGKFDYTENQASNINITDPGSFYTGTEVETALQEVGQRSDDWKNPTGFVSGDSIDVAYSYTNRTITLTGTLTYYWKGQKKTLTSPWTSSAHDNTVGQWYLYTTDGTTFTWSNTPWTFDYVQVAYVYRGASAATSFAIRETHRLMDWESHQEAHQLFGTYWRSGGVPTAGTYAENTQTDAAITPGFDQAIIKDEDLETTISAWTQGTYTTAYVGASSTMTFSVTESFPFLYTPAGYINYNNPTTGALVQGATLKFYNVYQILVPACSDTDSQKYRMIMLQPQAEYSSLTTAQGEDPRSLNLGNITGIFTEFTFYTRITYASSAAYGTTGKVIIPTGGITYIAGSRATLTSSSSTINNHAALSNLTWSSSGHTGTASSLASFDASGVATNNTDLLDGGDSTAHYHSADRALDNATVTSAASTAFIEAAQDAVGAMIADTATIDFTYTDATPELKADVKASSITEAMQVLADNTTQDVSTTRHGYVPKAPNDTTKFLRGDATWAVPSTSGVITYVIDGGGAAITTGVKGDLMIPFACTITKATLLADQSGSIVVDVWKDTYANYPPTDADSITSATPPTISSATKAEDATLTNWTTAITAGQTLRFNVDSATTVTRVTLTLNYTRNL